MRKGRRRSPETSVGVVMGGLEGAEVGLEVEVEIESSEIEGFSPSWSSSSSTALRLVLDIYFNSPPYGGGGRDGAVDFSFSLSGMSLIAKSFESPSMRCYHTQ